MFRQLEKPALQSLEVANARCTVCGHIRSANRKCLLKQVGAGNIGRYRIPEGLVHKVDAMQR